MYENIYTVSKPKQRESIPSLASSPLNNLKVNWIKSERKGQVKIENSRWGSGSAVVPQAERAMIDSRLGRRLFYVGFRVEETDMIE